MQFTESEARQFILQQHNKAYKSLCDIFDNLQVSARVDLPTFTIVDCVYRHCGQYDLNRHDLQYSLPYCVLAGAEYWTTVAHEMVHAFQRSLKYGDCNVAHGNTFLWLLGEMGLDISKPKQQIYHAYSMRGAEQIAEQLKKQRGGTSNHVSMQSSNRKSLSQLMKERSAMQ